MVIEPEQIIQYVAAIATGVGIWYKDVIAKKIGLKKEIKTNEAMALDNVQKNLDIYQEMITDIDSRYKVKLQEVEQQFLESINRMKTEVNELKVMNAELIVFINSQKTLLLDQKEIIGKQSKRIDYFKKKYNDLEN